MNGKHPNSYVVMCDCLLYDLKKHIYISKSLLPLVPVLALLLASFTALTIMQSIMIGLVIGIPITGLIVCSNVKLGSLIAMIKLGDKVEPINPKYHRILDGDYSKVPNSILEKHNISI